MKRVPLLIVVTFWVVLMASPAVAAEEAPPWASVVSFVGDVKVAETASGSPWAPVKVEMRLAETQVLKTGAQSQAVVRFAEGAMTTAVAENTTISLQDLLLKVRLDKMRGRIAPPSGDAPQTKMSVTPVTGVRGTEQAEGKAEEPVRQHYWNENAVGQ